MTPKLSSPFNRRRGRPRAVFAWPIYESKKQAAEALQWPITLLQQFQTAGAPGFKHGRVYLGELIPWLGQRGLDDPGIDWSREFKKTMTERWRIKLAQEQGSVLDRDETARGIKEAMTILFGELDRFFCSELPPVVEGLSAASVREKAVQKIEDFKEALRARFAQIIGKAEAAPQPSEAPARKVA